MVRCGCWVIVLSISTMVHCSVHNPPLQFPYTLDEVHKQFEGHLYHGVPRGTHVPIFKVPSSENEEKSSDVEELEEFLQLTLRHGDSTVLPRSRGEQPTPSQGVASRGESFPSGMEFALVHTDAFDIDDNYYLVVTEPETLVDKSEVLFYVTLVTVPNDTVVANPLPFVVHVEHVLNSDKHGAAIYAGVLILVICAIALLIPFTVRAKRRRLAGKPICACGSHEGDDREGLSREGKLGVDNPVIVVDEPDDRSDSVASEDRSHAGRETIQEHMMRSVSDIEFQPKWMDPHYKEDHHIRMHQPFNVGASASPSSTSKPPKSQQASGVRSEGKKSGEAGCSVKL